MAGLLGLTGCNSISFFPQGAAERAADRVIDEIHPNSVRGVPTKANEPEVPREPKKP